MNRWNNLPDLSKWFIVSHYSDITVPKEKFEDFINLTWAEIQRAVYINLEEFENICTKMLRYIFNENIINFNN